MRSILSAALAACAALVCSSCHSVAPACAGVTGTCKGFDDFGQETNITSLVAGEDNGGHLNGVVMSASVGDVQNLLVQ